MHERRFIARAFATPTTRDMLASGNAAATDLSLLSRAMDGSAEAMEALEALVDRYVVSGVAVAARLAGRQADAERVLDAVHDAFITAVDEALAGEQDNVAIVFQRLLGELAGALREPTATGADASFRISSDDMRQLRRDLITELRLTISLRRNPSWWLTGRRILHELRIMRRRVRIARRPGLCE
jgi:hypothetical protein